MSTHRCDCAPTIGDALNASPAEVVTPVAEPCDSGPQPDAGMAPTIARWPSWLRRRTTRRPVLMISLPLRQNCVKNFQASALVHVRSPPPLSEVDPSTGAG